MTRVFLSHASADAALADAIHAALTHEGHAVFLDHHRSDGIAPGTEWERTLYEELERADVLVSVVTPAYVESRWCFAEVALAKARGRVIVPLTAAERARHPLLDGVQAVEYATDPQGAMARLSGHLARLDAAGGGAWNPARPVFPGLAAFDAEDRAVFFGRDREIGALAAEMRARVAQRRPRALLVVGASGSGKSSLVRAGLVPHLLDDPAWWRVPPFTPGDAPLDALALALARARKEVGLPAEYDRVRAALPDGLRHVARDILLAAPGDARRLLVVADQLEETFTRAGDVERNAFLAALDAAGGEHDGAVAVVATLRSEFLGDLLRAGEGARLRERPYLLAPLGREHFEDIIRQPAALAGIDFDPVVVRQLVADTDSGEALPLLAYALARLTEGLARGARVDATRYAAVGGVRDAVTFEAERVLAVLANAGHTEAEVMATLLGFVTLDEHDRPTRRRQRRAELTPAAAEIVDAFVQARLLTSDTGEGGGAVIGVAHETLFSAWKTMDEAIGRTAEVLRLRRDLERDASHWAVEGWAPSLHWRGERLAAARHLGDSEPDLGETARAFVEASWQEELATKRRESEILTDRVMQSGLIESDPELALLYLLAAVDRYVETPAVVAAMRLALARQRLVGRVESAGGGARVLTAAISDDATRLAVADAGTNPYVPPSTRWQPPPPAGDVHVTLWRVGDAAPWASADLPGRDVTALAWSRDGTLLAAAIDERIELLEGPTLARLWTADVGERAHSIELAAGGARIDVTMIGEDEERVSFLQNASGDWRRAVVNELEVEPPAPPHVQHPPRVSHTVSCPHARRLLDIVGSDIEIWGADPVDAPEPARPEDVAGAVWSAGPHAPDDQPALSADGRRAAMASRLELRVIDVATDTVIARFGAHDDEEGDTYSSVALNGDGTLLVSGSLGGGRSHVWDVATGARLWPVGGRHVGISRDGTLVAMSLNGKLSVRTEGGAPRELADDTVERFAIDAAHEMLLAVQPGAEVVEYLLSDGSEGTVAGRYPATLDAVAFSADGRHVLGRRNGELLRWPDRSPEAVIARARRSVYRTLTAVERSRFEIFP